MKKPLLLIGAVLGCATVASGASVPTSSHELLGMTNSGSFNTATPQSHRAGIQVVVDISGANTWDPVSDPSNEIRIIDIAAAAGLPSGTPVIMNGIGWNTNQTAFGSSWLSEMGMYFDDNIAPDLSGLFLRPGAGSNFPGTASFSSPVIKLADVLIPDVVLPNGLLRLEFYESFDDIADTIDGTFNPGSTVTVQIVPAPGALALLGLAGLVGGRRRRS